MRKLITILAVGSLVGTLAACSQDAAGPGDELDLVASFALNGGFAYGVDGGLPGRGLPELHRLDMLPDSLVLSSTQETQINALLEAFQTKYQTELDALNAIHEQAHAAHRNGATREQLHDILLSGDSIRDKLMQPLADLRDAINAVLSAAQKTWLQQRQYRRCYASTATPLTDTQQAQITALREAFNTANKADLEAVKAAMDQARTAREAGKSKAEIDAIMATVKDAMTRLQAAGDQLRAAIDAVLTPEQRASNCFGRGLGPMGGPGMGRPGEMGPGGMGGPGRHAPPGW